MPKDDWSSITDLMVDIQDTDLFLVNRNNSTSTLSIRTHGRTLDDDARQPSGVTLATGLH